MNNVNALLGQFLCIFSLGYALILTSCSRVRPIDNDAELIFEDLYASQKKLTPFINDNNSLDTFLDEPWYAYDESNHIIWPLFKVYALRSKGRFYKVQIINYYDEFSRPGNYTLRVQEFGKSAFEWKFNAVGCGNVYTNKNYQSCMQDPTQNAYTYLNFSNFTSEKKSHKSAQKDVQWDMAFNGTEVKLNAGNTGPGDARLAHLYFYKGFLKNAQTLDFQKIAEISFSNKGNIFFELPFNIKQASFKLPKGIPRVINEIDWFKYSDTQKIFFTAIKKNWWIVKDAENETFFKLNFTEIQEDLLSDGSIDSRLTLTLSEQSVSDKSVDSPVFEWGLPLFNSKSKLLKWCLDLNSRLLVDCSEDKESWDIRLSVSNRSHNIRRWRINVANGAIGPLSSKEAMSWVLE